MPPPDRRAPGRVDGRARARFAFALALLAWLPSTATHAQPARPVFVHLATCGAPWDRAALERALSVELSGVEIVEGSPELARATHQDGDASVHLHLLTVPACADRADAVEWRAVDRDGERRRRVALSDVPASELERAIAMSAAALLLAPARSVVLPVASTSALVPEPSPAGLSRDDLVGELDAPRASPTLRHASGASFVTDPSPREDDLAMLVGLTGLLGVDGLDPLIGAHVGLQIDTFAPVYLLGRLEGAYTRSGDALGAVDGGFADLALGAGLRTRLDSVWLGGHLAGTIGVAGLSGHPDAGSTGAARASVLAGLEGALRGALEVSSEVSVLLTLGVRVWLAGLEARSPSGVVVALRDVAPFVRLGLAVRP